jgi:hypothetical protein
MKTEKMGDAMARRSWGSSFSGDPGAKFSGGKRGPGTKQGEDPAYEEDSVRSFYFCISSLAEPLAAARSGQGRAAFQARRSGPLTARTAAKESAREEKTWFSRTQDHCKTTEDQG